VTENMAYESAIEIYLAKLKSTDIKLKPKQNEALQLLYTKENSKVLVKLRTGYRKSIIIQLCPFILGNKCGRLCGIEKPVVLVRILSKTDTSRRPQNIHCLVLICAI
jgi:hypothetical protein